MLGRGYAPKFTDPAGLLTDIPSEWHGDWAPAPEEIAVNRARIRQTLHARLRQQD